MAAYPVSGWAPAPPPPPTRGVPWWGALLIGFGSFLAGAMLSFVALVVIGVLIGDDVPSVVTAGRGGAINLSEAAVGTCFRGSVDAGFDTGIDAVGEPVPCEEDHALELFGSVNVSAPADAEHRRDRLASFADALCILLFDDYVGTSYDSSSLDYEPVIPSAQAWAAGERQARCLLFDLDGDPLKGTAQGSGL